ncbi:MAG TPA: hypothetical protein VJ776_04140 [Thermoanaerobaculia bacterium]|nr:hypothetical protein [Thermoanaerobaculia bacterium]
MPRFGQAALLLAGFLAVSGSFGLHPEPERSPIAAATGEEWSAPDGLSDATPHICLACLAHRSVPLPRLSAVVLALRAAAPMAPAAAPSPPARLEGHPREGRAPPALG